MSTAIALPIRRPVLRYHGGKFRLAPRLIAIFPPHRVYTEAFGGGASVLLQKPLTEGEARERGTTLAALIKERMLVQERKAEANKGFKEELEDIDEQIKRAAMTIRNHGEERATECVVKFHSPVTGTKEIYLADSGELVETVAMTPEECQEHLFDQGKAEGASA